MRRSRTVLSGVEVARHRNAFDSCSFNVGNVEYDERSFATHLQIHAFQTMFNDFGDLEARRAHRTNYRDHLRDVLLYNKPTDLPIASQNVERLL